MRNGAVRLPAGFIGALALVACAEWMVSRHADRLAVYQVLGTRFARDEAGRAAPGCDVLALGDSVVKFGFDPATIERRLGVRAYNLAVPGTPPPMTYALLRRALEAGAKPSALVIGHMSLSGDPSAQVAELCELLRIGECAELAWEVRDPVLFASLAVNQLVPSVRYRHPLRARLVEALGAHDIGTNPTEGLRDHWRANRGMERRAIGGAFDGRMEPRLERSVYSQQWRVLAVYEHYLRRIAALAAERDIPVFWLVPPLIPEAQAYRDALGLDAHHSQNLHAIQARSPNLIVLDARHSGYPASAFFDSCHLNSRGAERLSGDIAAAIARRFGGESWVTLPPYDDRPSRIAAELPSDKVRR